MWTSQVHHLQPPDLPNFQAILYLYGSIQIPISANLLTHGNIWVLITSLSKGFLLMAGHHHMLSFMKYNKLRYFDITYHFWSITGFWIWSWETLFPGPSSLRYKFRLKQLIKWIYSLNLLGIRITTWLMKSRDFYRGTFDVKIIIFGDLVWTCSLNKISGYVLHLSKSKV